MVNFLGFFIFALFCCKFSPNFGQLFRFSLHFFANISRILDNFLGFFSNCLQIPLPPVLPQFCVWFPNFSFHFLINSIWGLCPPPLPPSPPPIFSCFDSSEHFITFLGFIKKRRNVFFYLVFFFRGFFPKFTSPSLLLLLLLLLLHVPSDFGCCKRFTKNQSQMNETTKVEEQKEKQMTKSQKRRGWIKTIKEETPKESQTLLKRLQRPKRSSGDPSDPPAIPKILILIRSFQDP